MTREQLAAQVIEMFKLQQAYFKSGKCSDALAKSKAAERALREKCEEICRPPAQKTLLDQTKMYRITSSSQSPLTGVEFEVPAGATEEEIATAAWDAVAEYVSFGWEEVES